MLLTSLFILSFMFIGLFCFIMFIRFKFSKMDFISFNLFDIKIALFPISFINKYDSLISSVHEEVISND